MKITVVFHRLQNPSLRFRKEERFFLSGCFPVRHLVFLVTLFVSFLFSLFFLPQAVAQVPQSFRYQAVVRSNGDLLKNTTLDVRLTLLQGSESGPSVWTETQQVTTNALGLFSLEAGGVTPLQVDWSAGPYYLKVETDLHDGNGFTEMGTMKMVSVPQALYALDVADKDDADADPANEIQDLQLNGNILTITNNGAATSIDLSPYLDNTDSQQLILEGHTLRISGGNSVQLPDTADDADHDPANEIQDLQLNGNILTITKNDEATSIDLTPYLDNPGWEKEGDTLIYEGSVTVGTRSANGAKLAVVGETADSDKPLFLVRRKDGQPLFTIYNKGVQVFMDNTDGTGSQGSFTVKGFGNSSSGLFSVANPPVTSVYRKQQMLWIPLKSALRTGDIQISNLSEVGEYSFATGSLTKASGYASLAAGNFSEAAGRTSMAVGYKDTARSDYSVALGFQAVASGQSSFSMGCCTQALKNYSIAMGLRTRAGGSVSTALGYGSMADGYISTALGLSALASNTLSLSMGNYTRATGVSAVAMGVRTIANSFNETVVGGYNDTLGAVNATKWVGTDPLFIIGNGYNPIYRHNAMVVLKNGEVYFPNVYWDEVAPSYYRPLYIDKSGKIGYLASSRRYKKEIRPMEDVDWLYRLRPVNFVYKSDKEGIKQYGLIAEEVEQVNPLFVSYDQQGRPGTVLYSQLVTPMLKALQQQQETILRLKEEVRRLKEERSEIAVLRQQLTEQAEWIEELRHMMGVAERK